MQHKKKQRKKCNCLENIDSELSLFSLISAEDGPIKVTVFINNENYALPRIEEIFSKLHGGVEFTKFDLSMA